MADAEDTAIAAFMADMPDAPQEPANPATGAQAVDEQAQAAQEPAEVEAAAEPENQEDVQTIEIDPDEPLFEQEIDEDGKKVAQKLSLKELQQGYLRDRDYRKKTQELARQREELPKLVAKQGQELSESYAKRLSELQALVVKSVAPELNGVDLNKLAAEDPFEYVKVSNRVRQIQELLQTVEREQSAITQKREEEKKKSESEEWQQSLEILQRDIPDFGPNVVKRLMDASDELGFTKAEIAQWRDHKIIKMALALADKKTVEAKRPQVEKKVAVVTKTMKPGQAQTKSPLTEARAKLKKTGKADESAVSVFEAFLH